MSEITIHTGCAGDKNTIRIEWFDHNNVSHITTIQADIDVQDKPRTLLLSVNGVMVGKVPSD